MKKTLYILSFIFSLSLFAQQQDTTSAEVREYIDKGLQAYKRADYEKAEVNFRKALAKDPVNAVAAYDLGLTKAEQENGLEAVRYFHKSAKSAGDKSLKSKAYFNEGNIWYEKQKYEKAIEAYKNALRNNPADEEARYNLALAMQKLKKKNQQNKQNKKDKQNKDQKNKDQKNKDQQNKDQKNKDQKNKDQKNKDQKNKDQKNKKDQDKKGNKDKKNKGDQDKKDQNKQGKDKKKDDKNGKDKKDKGDKKKDDKKKGDKKDKKDGEQAKDKKKQEGDKGNQANNQQGQGEKRKVKLTPQQVKQLLIALKNKEQKTQKKVKAKVVKAKAGRKKQDKDW